MSHYLISEASRIVDEESHVLRYWEEELALKIPRNDLGHRYYTEVQLETFRTIKELKQQGYQLREIRQCLEEMEAEKKAAAGKTEGACGEGKEAVSASDETDMRPDKEGCGPIDADVQEADEEAPPFPVSEVNDVPIILPPESKTGAGLTAFPAHQQARLREFRELMTGILVDAMEAERDRMSDEITDRVASRVIKEINYLDRERNEREEARFRELDEAIRSRQRRRKFRAEAAATTPTPKKKRKWRSKKYNT